MAEIKLITTEVGKNDSAITIGIGAEGADKALAIGVNAGHRGNAVLGEGSIDIRTADNGIFLGNSGESTAFGAANTDYAVFKVGGTETVLTAAQFRALLGLSGDISSIVDGGSYDSVGKKILLKHGDTTVAEIDATDFIKDGMVSSVAISGKNLVVSFNTDAGKEDISIPLKNIFDPDNYYNKNEADELLADKQDTISDLATIRSGAAAGATAVQPIAGKGLSENDFTNADKSKLDGIAAGAQVNPTPIDPAAAKDSGAFADALAVKTALAGKEPKTVQDGTAAHPYLIATRADLEQLQAGVAGGECFEGKHFLQTADIDMGSGTWTGIGLKTGDGPDRDHTFKGIYDGGGHAINNLKFAYDDTADVNETMGFFRSCVGATIKNLTVNVLGFDAPAVTSQKFGGAAFVGTMADGITMVNCTANGSLGSEAIPCKHTTAGIIAVVDFPSDPAPGHQVIDLSFVTNNADVYTTRKGAGIIGFLLHDVTLRHVTNTGLIKRCGADNGRDEGVAGIIAWENMGSGDGYLAKYILDGVANLGAVETNQPESGYRRYSSQLVGSWGLSNAGDAESVNLGDVKITLNDKSLPLGGNVQATQSGGVWVSPLDGMGLWFGEVKADGCCHAVKTLENGGEYVFLFKNKTHAGAAYTPPPYTLPSGYTVTIDQRFDAPNIVDSNGDPITGVRVGETDKYTYTAA